MKFLFVGDHWNQLKPATDTSLALVHASMEKGHKVWWTTAEGVRLEKGKLKVVAEPCLSFRPGGLPGRGAAEELPLSAFKVVWIRKDPPFDASYTALCWLLALEEHSVMMVNKPSLLLRYHEKLIPFEAVNHGYLKSNALIPTHVGPPTSSLLYAQMLKLDPAISKPFLGFGGSDIRKFSLSLGETPPMNEGLRLTQPFLPEIATQGDRRVFYLGGKIIGDFVRLPKSGDYVSNIARGGSGHIIEMKPKERQVAEALGQFLKKVGIVFAGADLMGARVSEVNITSPTGVRTYLQLTEEDLSVPIVDFVQGKAE